MTSIVTQAVVLMICIVSCTDLNVIESNENRLPVSSFTYCNDNGTVTSWIDHFLCSRAINVLAVDLNILYHCVTSDHM